MEKRRLLFVINQFFKGGAETALLNLLQIIDPEKYDVDFLIFDQIDLKDTIAPIEEIPQWIHVINICQDEKSLAFLKKAWFKVWRKFTRQQGFRQGAVRYLKNREYDVAISCGEWFSSALVATKVQAKLKYVWIHADMDKAAFLHPDILTYQHCFDQFIFVSERSREGAVCRYPSLQGLGLVAHNLVDQKALLEKSQAKAVLPFEANELPVLLTVANIREEKNHLRQIEAMELLRQQNIRFRWLNIGSMANKEQTALVQQALQKAGLQDDFYLMGAVENPYPFMKVADAVCVLSDHESWSMVITEAKTLGVPVIATRTSGALEQIVQGETGVLCDFTAEDIAEKIKGFLTQTSIQANIRGNLEHFSSQADVLPVWDALFFSQPRKTIYLFDDINYISGARNAALAQLDALEGMTERIVLSIEPCRDEALREQYRIIDISGNLAFRCLSVPIREVLQGDTYVWWIKLLRISYAVLARLHLDPKLYHMLLADSMTYLLNGYDTICVVSEASKLRAFVATLAKPRKVQWIHTDYAAWRNQSAWTRAITKRDGSLYAQYDTVVCLSKTLEQRFLEVHPQLVGKTVVIPNLIQYEHVLSRAENPLIVSLDETLFNIITIGRIEQEKRYDRLLQVAEELKKRALSFHWYFVGDGNLRESIQHQCDTMDLSKEVTLTGTMENPYPLMKRCSLLVLLSDYEGTPVTIDEAKVLGVPVLAGRVGGISDQLDHGRFGTVTDLEVQPVVEEIFSFVQGRNQNLHQLTRAECITFHQDVVKKIQGIFIETVGASGV